jgi:polyphosphate kinase
MHRNLDRRVEVLVPVLAEHAVREIDRLLDTAFDPGTAAWHLGQDGVWTRRHVGEDDRPLADLQEWLIRYSTSRRRTANP